MNVVTVMVHSARLAGGMEALLLAIPQVDRVEFANNLDELLKKVAIQRTGIVLLELGSAVNEPLEILRQIHALSPDVKRILLTDDVKDLNLAPPFAEAVFIQGMDPAALASFVTASIIEGE